MDTRITAVLLVAAVAAGGYAGWRVYSELGNVRIALANTKSELEKTQIEVTKAKSRADDLAKELDEQKIQVVSLRAERDSAHLLMQAAQRHSDRLQQDLLLAQQQVQYLRARAGVSSSQGLPPMVAPPRQPMIIQAVPAPRPQGAAVAAPVPGQGYGPR